LRGSRGSTKADGRDELGHDGDGADRRRGSEAAALQKNTPIALKGKNLELK
jgi:hypothetical protein